MSWSAEARRIASSVRIGVAWERLPRTVHDFLIEWFRPMSGLDNCFPSFHTSLTVVIVLTCHLYRLT
jgi:hypothetical protein